MDLRKIKPDFNKLQKDRFVDSGHIYKNVARYSYKKASGFEKMPNAPVHQPLNINPTRSNVPRDYPEYEPEYPGEIEKLLYNFADEVKCPEDAVILLQVQRTICSNYLVGEYPEGWHQKGVEKVGLVCIDRHNIIGGVDMFKPVDKKRAFRFMVDPGHLLVYNDRRFRHRITNIMPYDLDIAYGWRDTITLTFPECL